MAIQTEPTRIQIPFADAGTKNVIPDTNSTPSASQAASWTDGFPAQCSLPLSAGGIPPARADFNGILNTMTQSERFTQEGGVWEWDASVDYAAKRLVLGSDGLLYWSVAQSGPNVGGAQDPTADDGTYWTAVPTDDANVVHKTGDETVGGQKIFSQPCFFKRIAGSGYCEILMDGYTKGGTAPDSTMGGGYGISDENNTSLGSFGLNLYDDGSSLAYIHAYPLPSGTYESVNLAPNVPSFYPGIASHISLGKSDRKWKDVWANTGTIQTSDERLKESIGAVPDCVLDAWGDVDFVQFQMRDAVAEKGAETARLHSGLIAQRIDEAFKARGLDACRYGLFCYDEWAAEPEERDENGNIGHPATPAGDQFSLRYEEALCMEAAYQRRRADRAEARLAALEERLAAVEARMA